MRPDEVYLHRFEKHGKYALNLYLRSLKLWARRETIEKALKERNLRLDSSMKISHDVKGWWPRARLYPINFPLVFRHESCSRSRSMIVLGLSGMGIDASLDRPLSKTLLFESSLLVPNKTGMCP